MIDIIPRWGKGPFAPQIEAMHRLRHKTFKERLGWDVPSVDGLEIDEFDRTDTTYLCAVDDADRVVGMLRLLPTTTPYMLSDVFPQLLEGASVPRGPRIWEGSRFAVDYETIRDGGSAEANKVSAEIFCGLIEYGLACGVDEVITVHDIRVARLLPRLDIHPTFASRFHRVGKTMARYGRFEVSKRVLADIQRASGIRGSVIRFAPWQGLRHAA